LAECKKGFIGEAGKNCLLKFSTTVRIAEYTGLSSLFLPSAQVDKSDDRRYPVLGIWIVSKPENAGLHPLDEFVGSMVTIPF
jgi:hypothetical protein